MYIWSFPPRFIFLFSLLQVSLCSSNLGWCEKVLSTLWIQSPPQLASWLKLFKQQHFTSNVRVTEPEYLPLKGHKNQTSRVIPVYFSIRWKISTICHYLNLFFYLLHVRMFSMSDLRKCNVYWNCCILNSVAELRVRIEKISFCV